MMDSKRLYADFKRFMRRLRTITGKKLAYIVIIEPQESGSLHAHLLLKTIDNSRLYIPIRFWLMHGGKDLLMYGG